MAMGLLAGMARTFRKDSSKTVRHGTKRKIAKDYHRRLREIDAPDEARKVACCPKCSAWFASVEDRNAHREQAKARPSGCAEPEEDEVA